MGLNIVAALQEGAIQTGGYISIAKAIPVVIILLIWARLLTWVDKDAPAAHLPRDLVNLGLLGGMILAYALFFYVPLFIVGLVVLLLVMGIEAGVYLSLRKKRVGLKDLRKDFDAWLKGFAGKKKAVEEIEGAVQIVGPSGSLLPAPQPETPEAESYNGIQKMLTVPLENNAEIIQVAPTEDGSVVKYSVDGVVYTGNMVSKTMSMSAIGYLKAAAGLDMSEVRKPQTGTLKLNVNKTRRELRLTTKGSMAGESATFISEAKKRHDFNLETLGFQAEQIETIRNSMKEGGGIVLLSAPKGQGLTSLSYGMLRGHDAFLQHLMTIERDAEQDLEGITQNKLDPGATAAEEQKLVNWILSQQPDAMLISKPESAQSAAELIQAAKQGRRVYVSTIAGSTFDTLSWWRKLVGDDKLALSQLKMVISGRTLRKLCVACKVGYMPDPETLRKLNMDAARVEKLYQARKEPPRDEKGNPIRCEFCNDLRYKGRTGIYEILLIDEDIRQVILAGGSAAQLKTAFRKQRGRYLQEVGLVLVEKGDTSVQEVLRVLRAGETPSSGSSRRAVPAQV
jgi:type II secretory ATPase GspE/PulE/Tfp pilus assembly ATPase PilB-like protein